MQAGGNVKRCVLEVDLGVGFFKVERGRDGFVVDAQGCLQHGRRTGRAFHVTDLGFDRAHGNLVGSYARRAEELGGGVGFYHVPHGGGGAVGFDHAHLGGGDAGCFVGPLDGQALTMGIGGRDALALAVRGRADAAQHGVDLVAVALGVFQSLEQQDTAALAHDKAVGSFVEGAAQASRQGADFGELDEGWRAQGGIDAAR